MTTHQWIPATRVCLLSFLIFWVMALAPASRLSAATASPSTITVFTAVRTPVVLPFGSTGTPSFKLYIAPKRGIVEYYDLATSTYQKLTVGVSVSTKTWYYTSHAGYLGNDSFQWTGTDTAGSDTAKCSIIVQTDLYGKNWPQYRYNEHRTAGTAMQLPDNLYLQWTLQLPPSQPAWKNATGLNFDQGYEPVLMDHTLFVASNGTDKLLAIDTANGTEKWRFYTGGPIRFAPIAFNGKVYVGSDDGMVYCLHATTGSEVWRFRGGPSNRLVFANKRASSLWPVRGGLMLSANGNLYFTCGVWPNEGIFIYALNPSTGEIVWSNDSTGSMTVDQPHSKSIVAGLTPQGYLVMNSLNTRVLIPTGYGEPGFIDPVTGKLDMPWKQGGARWSYNVSSMLDQYGTAHPSGFPLQIGVGSKIFTTGPGVTEPVYTLMAGDDRLFVVGYSGKIYCFGGTSIASPPARTLPSNTLADINDHWKTEVSTMLSSTDRKEGSCVVVGIGSGRIVEELAKQSKFQIDVYDSDPVKVDALRRKLDDARFYGGRTAGWESTSYSGIPETYLEDTAKVAVHLLDPMNCELPVYAAKLIVSEDITSAGFGLGTTFVSRLYSGLRPYGGNLWLFTTAAEHTSFQGWVSSMGLTQATVSRNGSYSVLQRNGRLPGSTDFLATTDGSKAMSPDAVATAPLGALWYDDSFWQTSMDWYTSYGPDIVNGNYIVLNYKDPAASKAIDVYTGIPLSSTYPYSGNKNRDKTAPGIPVTRRNPFNDLPENVGFLEGHGCGTWKTGFLGKLAIFRQSSMGYYDLLKETGPVSYAGLKPECSSTSSFVGNGVLIQSANVGCSCNYPIHGMVALVHRPEAEQFMTWGFDRITNELEDQPIRKVAFNFGSPGDRMEKGVLWLHRPYSTPATPNIPVTITPESAVQKYIHDKSWVQGTNSHPWVADTGIKGMTQITMNLAYPTTLSLTTTMPPSMDGSLSDSCWNGAGKLILYHMNYGHTNPLPDGEVQIRHDANNLYLALRYVGGDVALIPKEAGWDVWLSDRVKLGSKSIHLRVDRDNVRYQALSLAASQVETWAGAWSSGYSKTPTEFIVEMTVPWATLAAEGYDKNALAINIQGPAALSVSDGIEIPELQLRSLVAPKGEHPVVWKTNRHESCTMFAALFLDTPEGDLGKNRTYTVRLHFTEPDDLPVGARKFDVAIQGTPLLTNFDITAAAGGARKSVVKEFTGIIIKDILTVNFTPKAGVPVISGIEILEASSGTPDIIAPTIPTGLVALAASLSQINLSWNPSTDAVGVTGYKIYRDGMEIGTSAGTAFSDTGLTPSTSYSYKVAAFDAAGNLSASSSTASATTLGAITDADGDGLLDAWEVTWFGSFSDPRSIPGADPDGDGFTNLDEYKAETIPVNSSSRLAFSDQTFPTPTSFNIQWQSVIGKTYEIQSSTDLVTWTTIASLTASTTHSTWTEGSLVLSRKFYRLRIP